MPFLDKNKNSKKLRVIKTGRNKESINKAVKNGFRPLIKKIEPSNGIRSKYAVIQNNTTGEIEVIGDYRMFDDDDKEFTKVIDWTAYYPYIFKSPFAAYLIPKDIKLGERVFIEDLIEDYIGTVWNQGSTFRLRSCEAIWNRTDLKIQYSPRDNKSIFIG